VLSPRKLGRVSVDRDSRVREPERPVETEQAGPQGYPLRRHQASNHMHPGCVGWQRLQGREPEPLSASPPCCNTTGPIGDGRDHLASRYPCPLPRRTPRCR
jgi:hypothetical protein